MVEKSTQSANAMSPAASQDASASAKSADSPTQKAVPTEKAATEPKGETASTTRVLGVGVQPGSAAASNATTAADSVASRRLAHGLSPETTNSTDAVELRKKEKEANAEDRKRKAQRKHNAKVVRRVILIVLIVIIIGVIVLFWMLRWGLHDDSASIQGKWQVQGTDTVIEINDEEIILTDEVAYDYVLDPEAKTLTFKFGALTGNGRYRFSLDHNMLAIDDGEFDAMETLMTDIPWTVDALSQKLLGNTEKSPGLEDGNMVLERVQ